MSDTMPSPGILGATGMVGQQFIALLAEHPWFKVEWLGASQRSEGKAFRDAAAWRLPDRASGRRRRPHRRRRDARPRAEAGVLGTRLIGRRRDRRRLRPGRPLIVSNSRNYRMEPNVPLLIPEVNADHLALLDAQGAATRMEGTHRHQSELRDRRARDGARAAAAVRPEDHDDHDAAGDLRRRLSRRAVVGHPRERHPAHRRREEEKIETETQKILGSLANGQRRIPPGRRSARRRRGCRCRTGTPDRFRSGSNSSPTPEAIIEAWGTFKGRPQELDLPSAPPQPIVYLTEANRPQPLLDVNRDGGMTVSVGRLRRCPLFDYKFVALGHNTIRGAAGAAILNAELMHREGLL